MTLEELSVQIEKWKNIPSFWENKKDNPLMITLRDPSMGPISMCGVQAIGVGFDWENGKILIRPEVDLVKKKFKTSLDFPI